MIIQTYLMINKSTNVVDNICLWDGGSEWTPPTNTLMLVQATTPTMVWEQVIVDGKTVNWILGEQLGAGDIGFTWNGTVCVTNEPKPPIPVQVEKEESK